MSPPLPSARPCAPIIVDQLITPAPLSSLSSHNVRSPRSAPSPPITHTHFRLIYSIPSTDTLLATVHKASHPPIVVRPARHGTTLTTATHTLIRILHPIRILLSLDFGRRADTIPACIYTSLHTPPFSCSSASASSQSHNCTSAHCIIHPHMLHSLSSVGLSQDLRAWSHRHMVWRTVARLVSLSCHPLVSVLLRVSLSSSSSSRTVLAPDYTSPAIALTLSPAYSSPHPHRTLSPPQVAARATRSSQGVWKVL